LFQSWCQTPPWQKAPILGEVEPRRGRQDLVESIQKNFLKFIDLFGWEFLWFSISQCKCKLPYCHIKNCIHFCYLMEIQYLL
jgi:hypothetical protein